MAGGGGDSHHPKAEKRAPDGSSCLARNDCPSVNNLLLPRAWGSEGRRQHNGFLELQGEGPLGISGMQEALNPGTGSPVLPFHILPLSANPRHH